MTYTLHLALQDLKASRCHHVAAEAMRQDMHTFHFLEILEQIFTELTLSIFTYPLRLVTFIEY